MVTKRKFCYNEPEGRVLRGRRARYTSPLGRVVDCGGWFSRGLWVMFSIGDTKCLSAAAFPENLSDHLPTRVFIQQTSNLDTTCISKLSRTTFFEFSNFDPIFGQKTQKSVVVVPSNPFRSATDQSFHSTDLKFGHNM